MLRKYSVKEGSGALIFLCQFRRIFSSNCGCDSKVKNRQTAENFVGSTLSLAFPLKNIGKHMSNLDSGFNRITIRFTNFTFRSLGGNSGCQ